MCDVTDLIHMSDEIYSIHMCDMSSLIHMCARRAGVQHCSMGRDGCAGCAHMCDAFDPHVRHDIVDSHE